MKWRYFMFFIAIGTLSCHKGEVKIKMDDQAGVEPEVIALDSNIELYSVFEHSGGWFLLTNGSPNLIFLDKTFSIRAKNDLPNAPHRGEPAHFVECPNSKLYYFFIDGAANDELYIEAINYDGAYQSVLQIQSGIRNGIISRVEEIDNDNVLIFLVSQSPSSNDWQTQILQYSITMKTLDTLYQTTDYLDVVDYRQLPNSNRVLCGWWRAAKQPPDGYYEALLFDASWNLINKGNLDRHDYLSLSAKRGGVVIPEAQGAYSVVVPVDDYSLFGEYARGMARYTFSDDGNFLREDLMEHSAWQEIKDVIERNDEILILGKDMWSSATHELVLTRYEEGGWYLGGKILRKTWKYDYTSVILKSGDETVIISEDMMNKRIVLLKY